MPASQEQKEAIAKGFIDTVFIGENQTAFVDRTEVLAVAEDAYNWAEASQSSYNSALLDAFRDNASLREKAILLRLAVQELVKAN